jgi:hypothetical protein
MEVRRLFTLVALVQCSDSFNLGMSLFTNPAYGQSKNPDVSLPAQKSNTIGGTLKPSDLSQSKLLFENFIIDSNLAKAKISELAADVNFKAPEPSIFGGRYKKENEFGVALYENRLRPLLENNQVLILLDCLMSYLLLFSNQLINAVQHLADRSRMLCLRCREIISK